MSTSTAASTLAQPSNQSILLARGVIARLAIWPALRLAVENNWGGSEGAEKRTWLASVIVDAFEQEDPTPDDTYVELTLLQVMEDEFETMLEDGSAEGVARDIVRIWDDVRVGNNDLVLRFEGQAEKIMGKRLQAEEVVVDESDWEDEDDESGDEDDEDEVPQLISPTSRTPGQAAEVDEDGFTMVKGKGKNHR